jgi:formate-dependent nitrite reductase membrane component NrfD
MAESDRDVWAAAPGCMLPVANLELWAEAEPWRAQPQRSWRLTIALYLYLGGLGAGSFVVAVLLDWLGYRLPVGTTDLAGHSVDWAAALFTAGPLIAGLGASFLILDLGRNWRRFFTACLNPRSSWMARGFIVLAGFIVFGGAVMVVGATAMPWTERHLDAWRSLQALAVLLGLGTAVYTGILLQSMRGIPAWRSPLLPLLFTASALSTGSASTIVMALLGHFAWGQTYATTRLVRVVGPLDLGFICLEAGVLVAFMVRLLRTRADQPEAVLSARLMLRGGLRYWFWLGVVAAALIAPAATGVISEVAGYDVILLGGCTAVLAGGFVLRAVLLAAGIRSVPPLIRLSGWQADGAWDAVP